MITLSNNLKFNNFFSKSYQKMDTGTNSIKFYKTQDSYDVLELKNDNRIYFNNYLISYDCNNCVACTTCRGCQKCVSPCYNCNANCYDCYSCHDCVSCQNCTGCQKCNSCTSCVSCQSK